MALENKAALTLLHVIETVEEADSEDFQKFYRQLGDRAGRRIDKIIARYGREGLAMRKANTLRKKSLRNTQFCGRTQCRFDYNELAQTRSRKRRRRLGDNQLQGRGPLPLPGYACKVKNPVTRRIMHLDMDAFYAAVEQSDNPELRRKAGNSGRRNARGGLCGILRSQTLRRSLRHACLSRLESSARRGFSFQSG